MRGSRAQTALVGLTLVGAIACAGRPEIEVEDLDGRVVRPLASATDRAVVLLFTATDCPISDRYAPEVRRLAGEYAPRGVRFFLVYADAGSRPEAIRQHVSDFGYDLRALRDPAHTLVRLTGATVTPEAVVFASDEGGTRLAYRGRIDDWYEDFGRARAAPTTHELADSLDAVLAGRRVEVPRTTAIGCFIPGAS